MDGSPIRDFIHAKDVARGMIFAVENKITKPINLGFGIGFTIRELAETIMDLVCFTGELVFDRSKPDGTMRKLMDVDRLDLLGYSASTSLRSGLELAYADFLENASTLCL